MIKNGPFTDKLARFTDLMFSLHAFLLNIVIDLHDIEN